MFPLGKLGFFWLESFTYVSGFRSRGQVYGCLLLILLVLWNKFSPFYPHGKIPIPFSEGDYSYSVEGLWQGLKVFDSQDIDPNKFAVQNMKNIKRTVRKLGRVLGHRKGVKGPELLNYREARERIYTPSYLYTLETFLEEEIKKIRDILKIKDVILLDYETNASTENLRKSLSHASLISKFIQERG